MIDQQTIDELKRQFENDVYFTQIGKQEYVFRSLTWNEYKYFSELDSSVADVEELVVLNAVVYPHPVDLTKIKPGAITSLCDEILEYSGFVSVERTIINLMMGREECDNAVELMKAFIVAAIPTYDYDELDNYTLKKITKLVARAEVILNIQARVAIGDPPLLTLSEEDAEEGQQQAKPTHKFDLEDLEKANRNLDGDTTIGAAPLSDPIAQKLHAALR